MRRFLIFLKREMVGSCASPVCFSLFYLNIDIITGRLGGGIKHRTALQELDSV